MYSHQTKTCSKLKAIALRGLKVSSLAAESESWAGTWRLSLCFRSGIQKREERPGVVERGLSLILAE